MILLCMWWTLTDEECCMYLSISWLIITVIIGTLISVPLLAYGEPNSCTCILCTLKMYITDFIGIRGFLNLEECAIGAVHSLDAFLFLTGLFFITVFLIVSLIVYFMIKHCGGAESQEATVLHYLVPILVIMSVVVGIGDTLYSFYIASQVYGQFNELQRGQVSCSSPVYYLSFVSVMIVFNYIFVEIALVVFIVFWLKIDFRGRFMC